MKDMKDVKEQLEAAGHIFEAARKVVEATQKLDEFEDAGGDVNTKVQVSVDDLLMLSAASLVILETIAKEGDYKQVKSITTSIVTVSQAVEEAISNDS